MVGPVPVLSPEIMQAMTGRFAVVNWAVKLPCECLMEDDLSADHRGRHEVHGIPVEVLGELIGLVSYDNPAAAWASNGTPDNR